MTLLEKVRNALRISVADNAAINDELNDLIEEAKLDLGIAGVDVDPTDTIIVGAIKLYCKMRFGLPEDYDKLKAAYDELKAEMSNATGYTDWEVDNHV